MNFDLIKNTYTFAPLNLKPEIWGDMASQNFKNMIKNLINYFAIPLGITAFIFIALSANQKIEVKVNPADYSTDGMELNYTVSEQIAQAESSEYLDLNFQEDTYEPYLGKSYHGFKEALAFKESRGNYFTVNTFGYLGKYQFGEETLKLIGIYNPNGFLYNPKLQERAFLANTSRNKWILRKDIQKYVGTTISDITITESGVLAAAHLAGPGNVKRFLRSSGSYDKKDAFGTSIKTYMKRFSGYDTSEIKPDKRAKATL